MADYKEIRAQLNALRDEHHEKSKLELEPEQRERTKKIKALRAELAAAIVGDDAKPCPRCDHVPHGIAHETVLRRRKFDLFEIGCLNHDCKNHTAEGLTIKQARDNWNQGVDSYHDNQDGAEPTIPETWIDPVARGRA